MQFVFAIFAQPVGWLAYQVRAVARARAISGGNREITDTQRLFRMRRFAAHKDRG